MRDLHAKKDRVQLKCLTLFVKGMLMINANARVSKSANKERRKKSRKQNKTKTRDCARRESKGVIQEEKKINETEVETNQRHYSDRLRKRNVRTRQEDLETELEKNKRRCSERLRLRNFRNHQEVKDDDEEDDDIQRALQEGLRELHRTKDANNPLKHRVHVCIICDALIIGTESINSLKRTDLKVHRQRLGVEGYRKYYGEESLHPDLEKQYSVKGFEGMLLSPRARHDASGFPCCTCCFGAMRPTLALKNPPKFAIANGFATGCVPERIRYTKKNGIETMIDITDDDLTDLLRLYLAPVRPWGCVLGHTGGKHKSIMGHYSFFETNLSHVCASLNHKEIERRCGNHVYSMICGRMTLKQKQIVEQRSVIDVDKYTALLNWFVRESRHPGYDGLVPSEKCPQPNFLREPDTVNNTDQSENPNIENVFVNGTFDFSTSQEPSCSSSVYDNEQQFSMNLIHDNSPTLLACGGNYANLKDVGIENFLVTIFPFGVGGPKMRRRTKVSQKECLRKYLRTSLPHFMRGDTVQIIHHMFSRILSFETGVMVGRGNCGGVPIAERLGKLTEADINSANEDNNVPLTERMALFTKSLSTTCRSLGYTPEAAKLARKRSFAMLEHFGMSSVFLTVSPSDECSFRVRLYTDPSKWVSSF